MFKRSKTVCIGIFSRWRVRRNCSGTLRNGQVPAETTNFPRTCWHKASLGEPKSSKRMELSYPRCYALVRKTDPSLVSLRPLPKQKHIPTLSGWRPECPSFRQSSLEEQHFACCEDTLTKALFRGEGTRDQSRDKVKSQRYCRRARAGVLWKSRVSSQTPRKAVATRTSSSRQAAMLIFPPYRSNLNGPKGINPNGGYNIML